MSMIKFIQSWLLKLEISHHLGGPLLLLKVITASMAVPPKSGVACVKTFDNTTNCVYEQQQQRRRWCELWVSARMYVCVCVSVWNVRITSQTHTAHSIINITSSQALYDPVGPVVETCYDNKIYRKVRSHGPNYTLRVRWRVYGMFEVTQIDSSRAHTTFSSHQFSPLCYALFVS